MLPNVGIVGLSHLGLVTAAAIASKGCKLVGFDADKALVEQLNNCQTPVFEQGLDSILNEKRASINFSSDPSALQTCDVVYIARDVPTSSDNVSQLEPIVELLHAVVAHLKSDATVVVHSQVSPGFTRSLLGLFAERSPKIALYYQVETLIFGNAVQRALQPERYIVGCHDPAKPLPKPYAALLALFNCPVLPMRFESAELAKIAINMFLVSSVMTTSILAELCESIGAHWSEIAPALKLDRRIGPHAYLEPGLGIAGGNLERDLMTVTALARQYGTDCCVVDAWRTHGRYRRDWVLRKLFELVLSKKREAVVAIWGLAYKAGTHSIKNSPAMALLESLGEFPCQVYDPKVKLDRTRFGATKQLESALMACRGADALVVMTPWQEFRDISPEQVAEQMDGRIVILDPFKALDHQRYSAARFDIHTLGVMSQNIGGAL